MYPPRLGIFGSPRIAGLVGADHGGGLFLGGIGWISSHDLDPAKAIDSKNKALEVEVISTDWKWLFIYPEQHIAKRQSPGACRPACRVHFRLTSATVMNSFFVPQLGSQIYTNAWHDHPSCSCRQTVPDNTAACRRCSRVTDFPT